MLLESGRIRALIRRMPVIVAVAANLQRKGHRVASISDPATAIVRSTTGTCSMGEGVKSAVTSLKEIVIILSGVTLTFAMTSVVTNIKNVGSISTQINEVSLFVLLTLNIVRFYHGNMRLLDDAYIIPQRSFKPPRSLALDFAVILTTSIMFAAMGAFLDNMSDYFACLLVILIMDIVWVIICLNAESADGLKVQKLWMINNIIFALLLFYLLAVAPETFWMVQKKYVMLSLSFITTFVDFKFSWPFYFPRTR